MAEKSKGKNEKPDFRVLIPGYSDDKIVEIIRKRNYYQPEAAELAIQEAIKRGLIHSEQDMYAEKFREEPVVFSIFPAIEDEKNAQKIRKSISRMFIVSGAIPVIYGFLQIKKASLVEGGIFMGSGLLWIFLSILIFKKKNIRIVNVLLALFVISAIYIATNFISSGQFVFTDIFASVVFYLLFGYGLLYLRRLNA